MSCSADFAPPGMWTNDNWFAKDGDTYHAFYLQVPKCIGEGKRWELGAELQQIGHATSIDLCNWTDRGPLVVPIRGTWVESLATGSVARFGDKWYMAFTVGAGKPGVGMAISDDLMTWKLVGPEGPDTIRPAVADGPVIPMGEYTGTWQGQPLQWRPCANPYLYPEPLDGWMVIVINAQVVGAPIESSGCLATWRSRDLVTWEARPGHALPRDHRAPRNPAVLAARWPLVPVLRRGARPKADLGQLARAGA